MKPILINSKVARTALPISLPESVKSDDVCMEITRTGDKSGWSVIYPALSLDDNEVVFAWDDVLWKAKSGRYQGRILVSGLSGCQKCVALHIGCPCTMGEHANEYFTHGDCVGCGNG